MARLRIILVALGVIATGIATANAAVVVRFVRAERFHDEDFRSPSKREALTRELSRFLVGLGDRYLKPGETLTIEVLDVDLAGRNEFWRRSVDEVRVMRDTTPPRVRLRYELTERGRVLRQAEETVMDWDYMSDLSARHASEWLSFEKAMLRDWFRRRFGDLVPRR